MLGVESESRTHGVEVHTVRSIEFDDFRVSTSDLTFRLDVGIDLERLITAAPARWAVSALAESPDDEVRRERAAAAVRAAGTELTEGTGRFDLAVVRIDGGGIIGGALVLFGAGTRPGDRLAYVLTPDVGLADVLAADRGRLAAEFVDGLAPVEGRGEDWGGRVQQVLGRFRPWIDSSVGTGGSGLAIVRAEPGEGPVGGRHAQPRPGMGRRAGQAVGRALGRFGLGPAEVPGGVHPH